MYEKLEQHLMQDVEQPIAQEVQAPIADDSQPQFKGRKRVFIATPESEKKHDEKRKRSDEDFYRLALRQKSVNELQQIFMVDLPYSLENYTNIIEEIGYRLKANPGNPILNNLIKLAFTQFNNSFPNWVKTGVFERGDRLAVSAALYIPYYLSLMSHNASGYAGATISHRALYPLFQYVAKKGQGASSGAISHCLFGIGSLVKSKAVSIGTYHAHDIELLLRQLSINPAANSEDISSSLLGLSWLCKSRSVSGMLPAQVISDLLAKLFQQQALTHKNISNCILAIGYLASANIISGLINVEYLILLSERLLTIANLDSVSLVNTTHGLSMLGEANAVSGLIDKIWCSDVSIACGQLAAFGGCSGYDISYILSNLSFLIRQHPLPDSNKLLNLELKSLLRHLANNYQAPQELERSINALRSIQSHVQIESECVFTVLDLLLKRHFQSNKFTFYLSYFVGFKTHAEKLNPLFEKLLADLAWSWRDFSSQAQQEILKAKNELKDTPWEKLLQQKFALFTPATKPAGVLLSGTAAVSQSSRTLKPFIRAMPSTTTQFGSQSLFKTLNSPTLKGVPAGVGTAKAGVSLFHSPVSSVARKAAPHQEAAPRQNAWLKACKNRIFSAIANNDLFSLEELLGLMIKPFVEGEDILVHKTPAPPRTTGIVNPNGIHSLFRHGLPQTDSKTGTVDILAKDFLNTEAEPLRRLIIVSKAFYFDKLLHACSKHVRFELAQEGKLDPILLYLPFAELKLFVQGLVRHNGVGIHAASKAVIKLVKALDQRVKDSSLEQRVEIHELRKIMLMSALETHRNHANVLLDIKCILMKVRTDLASAKVELANRPEAVDKREGKAVAAIQNPSSHTSTIQVCCNYLYESEDIEAVLKARLKDIPNVDVLAGALMNDGAENNRVADVLKNYLIENPLLRINHTNKTVIVPIEKGSHWYGLKISLTGHTVNSIRYYNSLQNEGDAAFMSTIAAELYGQGLITNKIAVKPVNCLQQPDSTSCGPYLIENIYCDVLGRQWNPTNPLQLCRRIRQRQLEILQQHRPDFYPDFYHRQLNNIPTVKIRQTQSAASQKSAVSIVGFFNSEEAMQIDSDVSKQASVKVTIP
jgi:hypothetical protein